MTTTKKLPAWQKHVLEAKIDLEYAVSDEGGLGVSGVEGGIAKLVSHIEEVSSGSSGDMVQTIELFGLSIKIATRKIKGKEDAGKLRSHYKGYIDLSTIGERIPVSLWRAGFEKTATISLGGLSLNDTPIALLRELVLLQDGSIPDGIKNLMINGEVPPAILKELEDKDKEKKNREKIKAELEKEEANRNMDLAMKWVEENPELMNAITSINEILQEVDNIDIIKLCRAKAGGDKNKFLALLGQAPVSQNQIDILCIEYLLENTGGLKDSIDVVEFITKEENKQIDLIQCLAQIKSRWESIK